MHDGFGERMDEIHDQIEAHITGKREVYYSASSRDGADGLPINNLDEIAVSGKAKVVYDDYVNDGADYVSDVVEDPTWLQIALWADEALKHTGDIHHHFLESVRVDKEIDGVKILVLYMGS